MKRVKLWGVLAVLGLSFAVTALFVGVVKTNYHVADFVSPTPTGVSIITVADFVSPTPTLRSGYTV